MIRFSSLRRSLVSSCGASSARSFLRSETATTSTCRAVTRLGRRRSRRWLRSHGWRVRVGSCSPRRRPGIRSGHVVRPIWTSQPVSHERPHPTKHDRPALPACHIPAEHGACEVRLHPVSSEKLSPVAARSHGAPALFKPSCLLVAPRDNQPPRDDVRGSNDPLLPATRWVADHADPLCVADYE